MVNESESNEMFGKQNSNRTARQTWRALGSRGFLIAALTLALAVGSAVPSFAAASATLSARQTGGDLQVSWSVKNASPSLVEIKVASAGRTVKTLRVKAALKKVSVKNLEPGVYQLSLTATKPKLAARKLVTVYGVPEAPRDVVVERDATAGTVRWQLPTPAKFTPVEEIELTVSSNGKSVTRILPANSTSSSIGVLDRTAHYEISVRTANRYGASPAATITSDGESDARELTAPRLFTQSGAEEVFGSFALMNRSPLGPVDFESSTVAAENPALQALQSCVTTGTNGTAGVKGLPNVGGVWATRTSTGTMILTSGASALAAGEADAWITGNPGIAVCANPALVAQMKAVAAQLSASAKVDEITPAVFDKSAIPGGAQGVSLHGKVFLNGGTAGETPQAIQLIWVVVGGGETVSQYILIRAGTPIDAALVGRMVTQITSMNR